MKIEALHEFIVLAKYLNYSAAAESLFIAQPVLSRHIALLETELGIKLFHRTTTVVTLTEDGQYFLSEVTKLMDRYDAIMSNIAYRKQGISCLLKVGVAYYAMNDYLGSAPLSFSQSKKDSCTLTYLATDPRQCVQGLIAGDLDIAILPKLTQLRQKNILQKKLFKEPLVAVMNKDHRFAAREYLSLADLAEEEFLSVGTEKGNNYHEELWRSFERLCEDQGFMPRPPQFLNQIESVLMHIQQGNGIYIGGRHMRRSTFSSLAFIPILDKNCWRQIMLTYDSENTHPALHTFIKAFSGIEPFGWPETYIGIEDRLGTL
ncbi:MAG: LysR family transcriptional regulator [Clostridiales Family XIII bacterium]|jgi:DNA-binding transcriptional LysR family regulator|nr:LysR family transcriptional regulator [Clostridiales Family XIII bacterium]